MPFDHATLTANFGRIWPIHVEAFTELLIGLRREFDGDLDLLLVMAVIGTRTLPARRVEGLSYGDFSNGQRHEAPASPINLQSVADCTGIPRETVRRKVRTLEAKGWIQRGNDGVLTVNPQAAIDLAPATEATLRYLVAVGAACTDAGSAGTHDLSDGQTP
jgi:hypothetical protein